MKVLFYVLNKIIDTKKFGISGHKKIPARKKIIGRD
jgi:hypothetical protein